MFIFKIRTVHPFWHAYRISRRVSPCNFFYMSTLTFLCSFVIWGSCWTVKHSHPCGISLEVLRTCFCFVKCSMLLAVRDGYEFAFSANFRCGLVHSSVSAWIVFDVPIIYQWILCAIYYMSSLFLRQSDQYCTCGSESSTNFEFWITFRIHYG